MATSRRIGGYATITDPDTRIVEFDTVSCCHCSAAIRVKPNTVATVYLVVDPVTLLWREEPGASCYHCMKPVCLACHELGTCVPLERMLERAEFRTFHPLI